MPTTAVQLLVKVAPTAATSVTAATTRTRLGARGPAIELTPLFSPGAAAPSRRATRRGAVAARGQGEWHVASLAEPSGSAWDACHALLAEGLGAAGTGVELAEPDLEQQWLWEPPARSRSALAAGECGGPGPQDGDLYAKWPSGARFDDVAHTQLAAARAAVGAPAEGSRVRLAHLDTGYDPEHVSQPRLLRHDLERSFVDARHPTSDATDRDGGRFDFSPGHGTATLALLAGRRADGTPLGGASELEVVPIRIADSVVLFRTSALVRAFNYVLELGRDPATAIDVISMSMGGLASAAWADRVNALYAAGIVVVTAAGNNFGGLPTRYIVFPARFQRVLAACGVMADGRPYADLPPRKMSGCYGPRDKEATALAAYTPNVPWARMGCPNIVDENGNGTSSATPQVAAAAALWIQKHRAALGKLAEPWMRAEAVRQALLRSATPVDGERARRLGRGLLRAQDALARTPASLGKLEQAPKATASFALLRVLTGLGIDGASPRAGMLELEALQLSQGSAELQELLDGLEVEEGELRRSAEARRLVEALADAPGASRALRAALAGQRRSSGAVPAPRGAPRGAPGSGPRGAPEAEPVPPEAVAPQAVPPQALAAILARSEPPRPASRPLRVYAFDPSAGVRLETYRIAEAVVRVRWEAELQPGPVGEYLEVIDVDPASGCAYAPVDLDHPSVLAEQGLSPNRGRPQFHQQMVYAVAMRTIEHFERALGRVALWAERAKAIDGDFDHRFVRRLRIYPHALREPNAYYSPEQAALLFGYFRAGGELSEGLVFTCLSHDIVAHETTHALLDGVHPRFKEPTGLDMHAFHEAFADLVALFQHFTLPDALRAEMGRARGDLEMAELLGGLAGQFGQAIGHRGALRSYIAKKDAKGIWHRREPAITDYANATEPHERGAVLVGAVFDAFLALFRAETEDLKRLASGGTGVLPEGALAPDLVERLCQEAASLASRVLNICVRALDYCPPVDLTFPEYLRALITADHDLVPDDPRGYRVAFISAFRARGIYPEEVATVSDDALLWSPPEVELSVLARAISAATVAASFGTDRYAAFRSGNEAAAHVWRTLDKSPALVPTLGLLSAQRAAVTVEGVAGEASRPEVHSVRPARRVGPDGRVRTAVVIEITQRWKAHGARDFYRGGCSLVCDLETGEVRYLVRKRLDHAARMKAQQAFTTGRERRSLAATYFERDRLGSRAFALSHRGE